MNGSQNNSLEQRRQYVLGFNNTMIKIWKEKIILLNAINTGQLIRSVVAIDTNADDKYTSVSFKQMFNIYGLFVDYGTGREVPRGNPGDIGRDKKRIRKKWFSTKHYASVMNLREFFADNLGRESANVISNALTSDLARINMYK